MEPSSVIIDFYGLPGCGKTTLCKELIRQSPETIIDVESIWLSYWKQSWLKRLSEIPLSKIVKLLVLFLKSPKLSKKERNIYWGFIIHILSYNHFKRTNYRVLVSDNGLVQDIVSLFYKKESRFSEKHVKAFSNLIMKYDNLYQVYCDIPVRLSLERIRTRNRNKGRLDLIEDNDSLENALAVQSDFFLKMNKLLNSINLDFRTVNMNNGVETIVEQVKSILPFLLR